MTEEVQPEGGFESSRRDAHKAQIALNVLVILSALAASAFFFYVLYTVRPFGGSQASNVDIPTSQPGAVIAFVEGEAGGLTASVRDLDDAEAYNAELSEKLRADMGIASNGRLLRLELHNTGKDERKVKLTSLTLTGDDGVQWACKWVDDVASRDAATALGKLRLNQGAREFTLPVGARRQLDIFVPGEPPGAGKLKSGRLDAGGVQIELEHKETRAAQ
ncbi:MAG: hypothetical protein IPK87_02830 [Planctomycetes bacterium]|nr:hypothetical protein [Planctomycetota bacterium]